MLDQARTSTATRFVQLVEHLGDEEFEQLLAVARDALRAIDARPTDPEEPAMPSEPDVRVHHTNGCDLCGRTDQHTHTQADWRSHIDAIGERMNGGR